MFIFHLSKLKIASPQKQMKFVLSNCNFSGGITRKTINMVEKRSTKRGLLEIWCIAGFNAKHLKMQHKYSIVSNIHLMYEIACKSESI